MGTGERGNGGTGERESGRTGERENGGTGERENRSGEWNEESLKAEIFKM